MAMIEIVGQKFNKWTVISFSHRQYNNSMFLCRCECGIEKIIASKALRKNKRKSCRRCVTKHKNSLLDGFNKFVIKNKDGCWGWSGCAPKNPGYGQFRFGMKRERAHRASWKIHFGEIPTGKHVLHKCDNRICSRPDHLFLGTHKDNIQDMLNKDRHPTMGKHGEANHQSKLDISAVKRIKELLTTGITQNEIAKMFDVKAMAISNIKNDKTWRILQ